MADAEATCRRRIRGLYGAELTAPAGVLHVAAVWRARQGRWPTLKITPQTPLSDTDRFVLGLARARADAILTTGKILREEPTLQHSYHDDPQLDRALAAWRADFLGRPSRPVSVVLTARGDIDPDHPLFRGPHSVYVLTGPAAARRLNRRPLDPRHRVMERSELNPISALDYLRGEAGFATVSIEAGASTSGALYRPTLRIDELLLSVVRGRFPRRRPARPRLRVRARTGPGLRRSPLPASRTRSQRSLAVCAFPARPNSMTCARLRLARSSPPARCARLRAIALAGGRHAWWNR